MNKENVLSQISLAQRPRLVVNLPLISRGLVPQAIKGVDLESAIKCCPRKDEKWHNFDLPELTSLEVLKDGPCDYWPTVIHYFKKPAVWSRGVTRYPVQVVYEANNGRIRSFSSDEMKKSVEALSAIVWSGGTMSYWTRSNVIVLNMVGRHPNDSIPKHTVVSEFGCLKIKNVSAVA